MALRIGFEDRGFGYVYVAISADVPSGGRVVASAEAPTGEALPAIVTRLPRHGSYALVAPELACGYRVTLHVVDARGEELASETYSVQPTFERAGDLPTSQRAAFGVDDIRYVNQRPMPDAAYLSLETLVDAEDGADVVHGALVACVPEGAEPALPELTVIKSDGLVFEDARPRYLWHEAKALPGLGTLIRSQFSVRLPSWEGHGIVWARPAAGGAGAAATTGFLVLDGETLWSLRDRWGAVTRSSSNGMGYHDWFLSCGRATDRELWVQSRTTLEGAPKISVVTPVFQTPMEFLRPAVESVVRQTYGEWELVLVNASPGNREIASYLAELSAREPRVKVVALEGNLGIALNTRAGIEASTGDYVAFFDHDDLLEPNALFEYAKAIVEHPDAALLYCDEDYLIDGRYYSGAFKPDFDRDLLLNHNYVTHLLCVSRRVLAGLKARGRLPGKEFDGAQDYALTLAVSSLGERIWHVRRFLYHWRSHAESTATNVNAKTWTDDAGRRALERYLAEEGIAARIGAGPRQNMYDLVYELPEDLSIRVVVSRTHDDARARSCVDALSATLGDRPAQIVVVDPFGTFEPGEGEGGRVPVDVRPFRAASGRAARRNAGAAGFDGDVLVFVDDACVPEAPDWVQRLLGPLVRRDVVVTGAGELYEDRLWRHLGMCFAKDYPRYVDHLLPERSEVAGYYSIMPRFTRGVSAVSASAMAIATADFERLGGFDEAYGRVYDDVDLCLKVRSQGGGVVVVPQATFIYRGRALGDRVVSPPFRTPWGDASPERCLAEKADEARLWERWGGIVVHGDPFYNEQLCERRCHYELGS